MRANASRLSPKKRDATIGETRILHMLRLPASSTDVHNMGIKRPHANNELWTKTAWRSVHALKIDALIMEGRNWAACSPYLATDLVVAVLRRPRANPLFSQLHNRRQVKSVPVVAHWLMMRLEIMNERKTRLIHSAHEQTMGLH